MGNTGKRVWNSKKGSKENGRNQNTIKGIRNMFNGHIIRQHIAEEWISEWEDITETS